MQWFFYCTTFAPSSVLCVIVSKWVSERRSKKQAKRTSEERERGPKWEGRSTKKHCLLIFPIPDDFTDPCHLFSLIYCVPYFSSFFYCLSLSLSLSLCLVCHKFCHQKLRKKKEQKIIYFRSQARAGEVGQMVSPKSVTLEMKASRLNDWIECNLLSTFLLPLLPASLAVTDTKNKQNTILWWRYKCKNFLYAFLFISLSIFGCICCQKKKIHPAKNERGKNHYFHSIS